MTCIQGATVSENLVVLSRLFSDNWRQYWTRGSISLRNFCSVHPHRGLPKLFWNVYESGHWEQLLLYLGLHELRTTYMKIYTYVLWRVGACNTARQIESCYRIAGNFRGVQFLRFSQLVDKPRKLNLRNKVLARIAIVICTSHAAHQLNFYRNVSVTLF